MICGKKAAYAAKSRRFAETLQAERLTKLCLGFVGDVFAQFGNFLVDLLFLIGGKFLSDPAGHYSNQSLRLVIDENPRQPVTIVGKADDQSICYEELKRLAE